MEGVVGGIFHGVFLRYCLRNLGQLKIKKKNVHEKINSFNIFCVLHNLSYVRY